MNERTNNVVASLARLPPNDIVSGSTNRCTEGGKAQRLSVFLGLPGGTRGWGWYMGGGGTTELITRTSWPDPGAARTCNGYRLG